MNNLSEENRFIEEFGALAEKEGFPRIAGRMYGLLLITNKPFLSAEELAEALHASRGSVSGMTRLLIQASLIERTTIPGERRDYFRIRPGAVTHFLNESLGKIIACRDLIERVLTTIDSDNTLARRRLEELRELYDLFSQEYPAIIERWKKKQQQRQGATQ